MVEEYVTSAAIDLFLTGAKNREEALKRVEQALDLLNTPNETHEGVRENIRAALMRKVDENYQEPAVPFPRAA